MIATAARDPWETASTTWAAGSTTFPATHTSGMLVQPKESASAEPSSSLPQPRATSSSSLATKRGETNSVSRGTTVPSASRTPRSRPPSTTSRSTSPSTTRTPRASSSSRSCPARPRVWGKNTTSWDQFRISSAWWTEPSMVPSTPSGVSRTS